MECSCASTALFGVFVALVSLYWWLTPRKYNLPPGPWCLPLVGYLPFLTQDTLQVIQKLKDTYGRAVGLYMGMSYTIVLNEIEDIKEAFNNPALCDRPPKLMVFMPEGLGFGEQNGPEWNEQRRFTMKNMKEIGVGKNKWEENLQAEIEDFVKQVANFDGKSLDIEETLAASISNAMTTLVIGTRLPIGDPNRKVIDDGVSTVTKIFSNATNAVVLFPVLMKFLAKRGFTKYAEDYRRMVRLNDFIKAQIGERRQFYQAGKDDIFIDGYLTEIIKSKERNSETYFNDYNLCGSTKAMVIGGSDSSKTTLLWIILAMATHPDVQKTCQDEIDLVLGKDGKIRFAEKNKLPYTYATMMELLRWKTPGPLGVLHTAREHTKVGQYDVPKGTNIAANIYAVHNDTKFWKEPDALKPERFLDKDGGLNNQKMDYYIPFSVGKRDCPGQNVAMMQVFQFFTALLQNFSIFPSDEYPLNTKGLKEGTFVPPKNKLKYIPRY